MSFSIDAARRWFNFVKDLNDREPKHDPTKRKPIPVHNSNTAIVKRESRTLMLLCRFCSNPFVAHQRPDCPAFNGPCLGVTEARSINSTVEAIFCRWCGNLFTPTNRPKCPNMHDTPCHGRSEKLP